MDLYVKKVLIQKGENKASILSVIGETLESMSKFFPWRVRIMSRILTCLSLYTLNTLLSILFQKGYIYEQNRA